MATTSGKGGQVEWNSSSGQSGTELAAVTGWTMTRSTITHAYHCTSGTGTAGPGTKERIAGVSDWTATVNAKYDGSILPTEGQEAEVTLYVDDGEAISGQHDRYYGNCVIDSVQVEVDVDTGKIVSYVLSLSGDGTLTFTQSVPA